MKARVANALTEETRPTQVLGKRGDLVYKLFLQASMNTSVKWGSWTRQGKKHYDLLNSCYMPAIMVGTLTCVITCNFMTILRQIWKTCSILHGQKVELKIRTQSLITIKSFFSFHEPMLPSANFSHKGPHNRYFQLCMVYCLSASRLCDYRMKAVIDNK